MSGVKWTVLRLCRFSSGRRQKECRRWENTALSIASQVRAGRLSCVTGATSTPDTSTVCGRSPISLHRSVHSTPSMKDHQVPPSRSSLPRVVSRCHLSRGLLDNGRHKYKHNSARFTYTCTHHVCVLSNQGLSNAHLQNEYLLLLSFRNTRRRPIHISDLCAKFDANSLKN